MRAVIQKFRQIAEEMARERGVAFLGLFERETGLGRLDVVVAAPWAADGLLKPIEYVIDKMRAHLTPGEFLMVSRVVPLSPSVPFVKTVQEMVGEVDGVKELPGFDFDGMELRRGYVLLSHSDAQSAPRMEMPST
jgi:hypothetical protein